MKIQLTLTAMADRDPSCNLFTMTEVYTYPLTGAPTPAKIKEGCKALKTRFKESWPHGQYVPHTVPIDVDIRQVDDGNSIVRELPR